MWQICRLQKNVPITIMITNQEKEVDFIDFFTGIVNLSDEMGIEFNPLYVRKGQIVGIIQG